MHEVGGFQCERFRFTLKASSLLVLPSYNGCSWVENAQSAEIFAEVVILGYIR